MLKLTIRLRLILTMGFLGILILAIGGLGVFGIKRVNADLKDVYSNRMASAMALDNAKNFLNRARFNVDKAALHPDAEDLDKTIERAEGFIKDGEKSLQIYAALPFGPGEKELAADLDAKRAAYVNDGMRALLAAAKAKDAALVDELAMRKLTTLYGAFQQSSSALEEYQMKAAKQLYAESQSFYSLFLNILVAALVIGAALIILSSVLLMRAIMHPLDQALGHFEEIAEGNLANHIIIERDDEMGQLMTGLNKMQDQLAGTVLSVRNGSTAIANASKEIAAGNLDLSSRTEEQAASLEETASSLEELTSTVRQNADNARQANQLAISASDVASRGGNLVSQVVETMETINTSSRRIVDIISVIDGIAFQTNILALNAAVEAARAGEQGRGFAVVASEVRNLAQRSAAAAKEIKDLITASVSHVDAGTELVGKAGTTMTEIVGSVARVTDIIGEIMVAGEEQSQGIDQINQAISQMDSVTQQNAALVEEAAAAAGSLQEQAGALEQLVSVFRVQAQGQQRRPAQPARRALTVG